MLPSPVFIFLQPISPVSPLPTPMAEVALGPCGEARTLYITDMKYYFHITWTGNWWGKEKEEGRRGGGEEREGEKAKRLPQTPFVLLILASQEEKWRPQLAAGVKGKETSDLPYIWPVWCLPAIFVCLGAKSSSIQDLLLFLSAIVGDQLVTAWWKTWELASV